jgi:VanZ family protein
MIAACGSQSLALMAQRSTDNPEDSDETSALRTEQLLRALPLSRILRLIWLAALAAVIVGSLAPAQSGVTHLIDLGGINDKVEHFTTYAVLAALPNLQSSRCRRIGAAMVFLFLLGAALELGQLFSPGRTCDWHDLLANSCGILAGLALVGILHRFNFKATGLGHFAPTPAVLASLPVPPALFMFFSVARSARLVLQHRVRFAVRLVGC